MYKKRTNVLQWHCVTLIDQGLVLTSSEKLSAAERKNIEIATRHGGEKKKSKFKRVVSFTFLPEKPQKEYGR